MIVRAALAFGMAWLLVPHQPDLGLTAPPVPPGDEARAADRLNAEERQLLALQVQSARGMRDTVDALMLLARSTVQAMPMQPLDISQMAVQVLADLPEDLARPFSEVDGTRGRLVFITPTNGKDDNDLHYLLRWADSFRLTKLPNGDVIRGSGRAVIFADILDAVLADIPKAAAVSLSLTVLTVFLAFGMTASVYLITDFLFGEPWTAVAAAVLGGAFAWFWFGHPLLRRLRDRR